MAGEKKWVMTEEEKQLCERAIMDREQQQQERREQEFKPKEEFIASVGVCDESGQSHQVFKIISYGWVADDSGIIGPGSNPSITERVKYLCKICKVLFDPTVDPKYREPPHPVRRDPSWY